MSTQHISAKERQESLLTEEDLIDDSTGVTPTIGLGKELSLMKRFERRLSGMLAADLHIDEGRNGDKMNIFLSRGPSSPQPRLQLDDELRKFVRCMEEALTSIAEHPRGLYATFSSISLLTR
jgi:hypothetical protein